LEYANKDLEVVEYNHALKWAEGLITQLPQTHGGRNSWLKNHGKATEVIMDPEAVVSLLHRHETVHITDEHGTTILHQDADVATIKRWQELGCTFTWIRRP